MQAGMVHLRIWQSYLRHSVSTTTFTGTEFIMINHILAAYGLLGAE